jgi:glycosyltransferase involved in cell wall biosynthesis
MTAFNTARYLPEAIDSILHQRTSRPWELIFVDDGSDDGSCDIALDYAGRFPGVIRVFRHPDCGNRGISASRNLALRHARGPLLTFLDSDDIWLPDHLETQAGLLDEMPHVTMVYAEAERWVDFAAPFDEATARAAAWGCNYLPPLLPPGQPAGLLPRGKLLRWFREDESLVPCICTVMLRTAAARAVGGFQEEFRGLYDDQAFHAKIASNYLVFAHASCVARYRQHADSCCRKAQSFGDESQRESARLTSFLHAYAAQADLPAG